NPITSGSSSDAETLPDTEESETGSPQGKPTKRLSGKSSPSEPNYSSSDEDEPKGPVATGIPKVQPVKGSNPPPKGSGPTSTSEGQGTSQVCQQTQSPSETSASHKRTPPPQPPHKPPHKFSKPPSAQTLTMAQREHAAQTNALDDRITEVNRMLLFHRAGSSLLTPTQVQILEPELKDMTAIRGLHTSCYQHFENDPLATPSDALTQALKTQRNLEVSVPKFLGAHREWPPFRTEFNLLVAQSNTYSPFEKMRLLIEALSEGEASQTITELVVTNINWPIAWKRVTDRYDSPQETAHSAIRPLLELPSLMSQTDSGLHKLISTVRTTRSQLQQIPDLNEAEILYLHFIMARLDTKKINEFNQSLENSDVPALDVCITFLENEAKNLGLTKEIRHNSATDANPKRVNHQSPQDNQNKMVMIAVSDTEGYTSTDSRSTSIGRTSRSLQGTQGKSPKPKKKVLATVKRSSWSSRNRSSSRETSSSKKEQEKLPAHQHIQQ
ncbi:unnamed protein product, partial [Allacma fusca]